MAILKMSHPNLRTFRDEVRFLIAQDAPLAHRTFRDFERHYCAGAQILVNALEGVKHEYKIPTGHDRYLQPGYDAFEQVFGFHIREVYQIVDLGFVVSSRRRGSLLGQRLLDEMPQDMLNKPVNVPPVKLTLTKVLSANRQHVGKLQAGAPRDTPRPVCSYKDQNGRECAIGVALPPRVLWEIEQKGLNSDRLAVVAAKLPEYVELPADLLEQDRMLAIQRVHDTWPSDEVETPWSPDWYIHAINRVARLYSKLEIEAFLSAVRTFLG